MYLLVKSSSEWKKCVNFIWMIIVNIYVCAYIRILAFFGVFCYFVRFFYDPVLCIAPINLMV